MAVMDRLRPSSNGSDSDTKKLPKEVEDRINRGAERLRQITPERNLAWEFFRGKQFAYLNDKNVLNFQSTVTSVNLGGKPAHRMRRVYNLIVDAVEHEASLATQRIPSFEVGPATEDWEDASAAKLAEKVALYGYGKWNFRQAFVKLVKNALVSEEGFVWPYFDNTVGPFIEDGNGGAVGQGEIKLRVYTGTQVGWEPGQRFEDSQWHFVEYAKPPEEVMRMEGYLGGNLKPDADTDSQSAKQTKRKMVLVREYLEQPSSQYPLGRWIVTANGRRIAQDRNYPCAEYDDFEGPCLHRLSYIIDPDSDRDQGLVRHQIDPQRAFNFAKNRQNEWTVFAMLPQVVVTPGLMGKQRLTDEPNAILEIPQPDQNIKFRDVLPLPNELFEMEDRAQGTLARISAQNDPPPGLDSARALSAWMERTNERRQMFIGDLAETYASAMHHCLVLVQHHYTEDRLIKIKGRFGWESIKSFQGSQLRSQVDVTVAPGSIEPRTKQAIEQKVLAFADRGWISPQAAMHAIDLGSAEKLIEDVNLDVGKANRIIQRILQGPDKLFAQPEQVVGIEPQTVPDPSGAVDPTTGQPAQVPNVDQTGQPKGGQPIMAPSWMPRQSDNISAWKSVFESWFKTEDYETLEPGMQTAAMQVYTKLLELEAQKQQEAVKAQEATAAQQGMDNAARPQTKGTPDNTAVSSMKDGAPPTPNQPADQSPGPQA